MENFKDELSAEITAKVVHSLGIIMENKLSGMDRKKTSEAKTQTKIKDNFKFKEDTPKEKVKQQDKQKDVRKVQKEAMRMSMELSEDTDSKV